MNKRPTFPSRKITAVTKPRTFTARQPGHEEVPITSITVEDDSYTIRQLLEKAKHGNVPMINQHNVYVDDVDHDSPDYDALTRLDINERNSFVNDVLEKGQKAKMAIEDAIAKQAENGSNAGDEKGANDDAGGGSDVDEAE